MFLCDVDRRGDFSHSARRARKPSGQVPRRFAARRFAARRFAARRFAARRFAARRFAPRRIIFEI